MSLLKGISIVAKACLVHFIGLALTLNKRDISSCFKHGFYVQIGTLRDLLDMGQLADPSPRADLKKSVVGEMTKVNILQEVL